MMSLYAQPSPQSDARPIWLEAFLEIPVDRIPLPLLSPGPAFDQYYEALIDNNPGYEGNLKRVFRHNLDAISAFQDGNFRKCMAEMERSLAIRRLVFDEADPEYNLALRHLIVSLNCFAIDLIRLDDFAGAYDMLERSRSWIDRLPLGERDPFRCIVHHNYANYYVRRKRFHAAHSHLHKALSLFPRLGLTPWLFLGSSRLASILFELGRFADCMLLMRDALASLDQQQTLASGDSSAGSPPLNIVADSSHFKMPFGLRWVSETVKTLDLLTACRSILLHNMSCCFLRDRKHREAADTCEQALATCRPFLAPSHRWMKHMERTESIANAMPFNASAFRKMQETELHKQSDDSSANGMDDVMSGFLSTKYDTRKHGAVQQTKAPAKKPTPSTASTTKVSPRQSTTSRYGSSSPYLQSSRPSSRPRTGPGTSRPSSTGSTSSVLSKSSSPRTTSAGSLSFQWPTPSSQLRQRASSSSPGKRASPRPAPSHRPADSGTPQSERVIRTFLSHADSQRLMTDRRVASPREVAPSKHSARAAPSQGKGAVAQGSAANVRSSVAASVHPRGFSLLASLPRKSSSLSPKPAPKPLPASNTNSTKSTSKPSPKAPPASSSAAAAVKAKAPTVPPSKPAVRSIAKIQESTHPTPTVRSPRPTPASPVRNATLAPAARVAANSSASPVLRNTRDPVATSVAPAVTVPVAEVEPSRHEQLHVTPPADTTDSRRTHARPPSLSVDTDQSALAMDSTLGDPMSLASPSFSDAGVVNSALEYDALNPSRMGSSNEASVASTPSHVSRVAHGAEAIEPVVLPASSQGSKIKLSNQSEDRNDDAEYSEDVESASPPTRKHAAKTNVTASPESALMFSSEEVASPEETTVEEEFLRNISIQSSSSRSLSPSLLGDRLAQINSPAKQRGMVLPQSSNHNLIAVDGQFASSSYAVRPSSRSAVPPNNLRLEVLNDAPLAPAAGTLKSTRRMV